MRKKLYYEQTSHWGEHFNRYMIMSVSDAEKRSIQLEEQVEKKIISGYCFREASLNTVTLDQIKHLPIADIFDIFGLKA